MNVKFKKLFRDVDLESGSNRNFYVLNNIGESNLRCQYPDCDGSGNIVKERKSHRKLNNCPHFAELNLNMKTLKKTNEEHESELKFNSNEKTINLRVRETLEAEMKSLKK